MGFNCNGEYYCNVENQTFAKAFISGNLKLFVIKVYTKSLGVESFQHCSYAIQKNEKERAIKLTYKSLKDMISDNSMMTKELESMGDKEFKKALQEALQIEFLKAIKTENEAGGAEMFDKMLETNLIITFIKKYNQL